MERVLVDIEEESKKFRLKELYEAGDRMERAIVAGERVFLDRDELAWLRVMVERGRVNLDTIKSGAKLSVQAEQLVEAFGPERFLIIIPETVMEVVKNPKGEVFKGGAETPESTDETVLNFTREYLEEQIKKGGFVFDPNKFDEPNEAWKKNTVFRIEAVIAVVNKLLWVMQADEPVEDFRRQSTDGVLKHLRERVMRGAERAGEKIDPKAVRSEEEVIRFLPPKSLGVILDHLTRV